MMPVTVNGFFEEAAPPEFGGAKGDFFFRTTFRPMEEWVRGDAVAPPADACDEEGDDGAAGNEAEKEGASGKSPIELRGKRQGGGGDVEEDAVTLNGDDLVFLQ